MAQITFYKHEPIPMEMHKVKIVQQLKLLPTAERLKKIYEAGFNTFQLHNGDIFMDMLTDSGVNAMSDQMQSAMFQDNLYFIKTREAAMRDKSVREICRMIADRFDIIYFSARKFGFARGGAILMRDEAMFHSMEDLVPMFEGFLTYGGILEPVSDWPEKLAAAYIADFGPEQ